MPEWIKQRDDVDMEIWCAEIKLRASRKIGELTRDIEKGAGRPSIILPSAGKNLKSATLANAGIGKNTASRCEKLVAIPEANVEAILVKARDEKKPVTYQDVVSCIGTNLIVQFSKSIATKPYDSLSSWLRPFCDI